MRVTIFGLGYVGTVTAACLARDGHHVVGVEINPEKAARVAQGLSPIVEPGLSELLADGAKAGRIQATTDSLEAVSVTDVSMISVGTPPGSKGEPDLSHVYEVCHQIGRAIREKGASHVVVIRSTIPPGTTARCETILSEAAGRDDISIAFNPEFLREGSAVEDYVHPPYTIVGTRNSKAEAALREMYGAVDAPIHVVEPEVAEMVKYVSNGWHAAKVAFANEIGRIARGFGVSGRKVMELVVADTKLNISAAYMKPGFAYGGSCLPKDLASLIYHARGMGIPVPMLEAIPQSNTTQIDLAVQEVLGTGARTVAVLGLAFKPRTDDLRMSPAVPFVKQLLGEGVAVRIYDRSVYQAKLTGTNLAYIEQHLPHFDDLLAPTLQEAIAGVDLVTMTYSDSQTNQWLSSNRPLAPVMDLTRQLSEG